MEMISEISYVKSLLRSSSSPNSSKYQTSILGRLSSWFGRSQSDKSRVERHDLLARIRNQFHESMQFATGRTVVSRDVKQISADNYLGPRFQSKNAIFLRKCN